MARIDEVLLRLKFQTDGTQQLIIATNSLAALQQKANEINRQQAATATANAASLGKMAGSLQNVERAAQSLEHNVGGLSRTMGALPGILGAITAAGAGTAGALGLVSSVLGAGADMEKWKASFGVLLGGADEAEAHLARLFEFAATTPFQLPEVIEASKLLEALGLETEKYLRTLGDVASFMDRDLKSAVLAVGNAQRGEYEMLKTFGVNISEIFKKAGLDINSTTRRTVAENQRIVDELMKGWQEKFGGGMEVLAKTTAGKLSNILDQWFQFKVRIAQSGVGDVFSGHLSRILDKLEELEKNGTLEKWAKSLGTAMEVGIGAVVGMAEALNKMREPLIFLAGAAGILALAAAVQGAVGAYTAYTAAALAAGTSTSLFAAAVAALGGPVTIALALLGGFTAWAISQNIAHEFDEMHDSVKKLNEELDRTKLPDAAAGKSAFAGAITDLAEAQKKADALEQWLREMNSRGADVRIMAGAQKELDDLLKTIREIENVRDGMTQREAPIALPAGVVSEARKQTADLFAIKPGESVVDYRSRLGGGESAAKGAAELPGPTEKELADAKRRFTAAVQLADSFVKLSVDTAGKLADVASRGIERRLAIENAGATERLAALELFEKDAAARSVALASARADAEVEIEQRRAAMLAAAQSSGAAPGVTDKVIADINRKADAERRALDASMSNGTALLAFDRKIADQRTALQREVDLAAIAARTKEHDARIASFREVAKFEIELTRITAQQLLEVYRMRRDAVAVGSAEWVAWNEKIEAATKLATEAQVKMNEELAKFLVLGIDATRARELMQKEITPEDVAVVAPGMAGAAAANAAEAAAANAALDDMLTNTETTLRQAGDLWTVFFHDLGLNWETAAIQARGVMAGFSAAGAAAFNTLQKAANDWLKHHRGTHGLALAVLKNAAKEGAAAYLESVAASMRADAVHAAGLALKALGLGLTGHPGGFAAAAKFGAAAAFMGAQSIAVGAAASAVRGDDEAATSTPLGSGDASTNRSGDSRALRTVSGSSPITQNWNLSIQFIGTNIWMPGAADELAQALKPALQALLNNRELTVPVAGGK